MQLLFYSALVIVAGTAVFAVQNNFAVTVRFLVWHFSYPFSALLIAALCAGALVSLLVSLPARFKKHQACAAQQATIDELHQKLAQINKDSAVAATAASQPPKNSQS
jgi:uncharacterized integral membrane protein